MAHIIDLTGKTFHQWTVLNRAENGNQGAPRWNCICKCGRKKTVRGQALRNGNSRSCGNTHGMSKTKAYKTWINMIRRCTRPLSARYKDYGGRGIKVCKRWQRFENFLADMGKPPKNKTLDRKNNDGDYCKSNCQWATRREQARNRRNTRWITLEGRTQSASEWARELGITRQALYLRLRRNGVIAGNSTLR